MRKLSTGQDSTLKSYIENAKVTFGEDSPAVAFLKEKAAGAPKGEDEEVIARPKDCNYSPTSAESLRKERGFK